MSGFPAETKAFLEGISAHNEKAWFEANRSLYEVGYVDAGRAMVETLGPKLRKISPEVGYDPKVGGSMMRVFRDVRFSKDKRPYKDHLDLWFWHGDGKGWSTPGFFMRLTSENLWLGTGMHHLDKDQLAAFRDAVVDDKAGKAMLAAITKVEGAGPYSVGGKTRKQVPRGYDKDHARAEYLLYEAFFVHFQAAASVAYEPNFSERAIEHFRKTWPIGRWLLDALT